MNAMTDAVNFIAGDKKQQIKSLLKEGIPASQVALAVNVEPSYISQLMLEEEFSREVIEARYAALRSFTARDNKYDSIEDRLLLKLEEQLPLMMNPDRILRAIAIINNAKRRGVANDQPMAQATQVINLTLPTVIVNRYKTNTNNEVIDVNGEALIGMPAERLLEQVGVKQGEKVTGHEQPERSKELSSSVSGDKVDEVVRERVGRLLDHKLAERIERASINATSI